MHVVDAVKTMTRVFRVKTSKTPAMFRRIREFVFFGDVSFIPSKIRCVIAPSARD